MSIRFCLAAALLAVFAATSAAQKKGDVEERLTKLEQQLAGLLKEVQGLRQDMKSLATTGEKDFNVHVIKLKHGSAESVAETLQGLLQGKDGQQLKIVADPRTNSVLVSGRPELREVVEAIVERLDTAASKSNDKKPIDGKAAGNPFQPGNWEQMKNFKPGDWQGMMKGFKPGDWPEMMKNFKPGDWEGMMKNFKPGDWPEVMKQFKPGWPQNVKPGDKPDPKKNVRPDAGKDKSKNLQADIESSLEKAEWMKRMVEKKFATPGDLEKEVQRLQEAIEKIRKAREEKK